MHHARKLAVGSLLALAACDLGTDPAPRVKYGLIAFGSNLRADGSYSTRPVGLFFRSLRLNLPDSRASTDTCSIRPYVPPSNTGFGSREFLNAGDSITFQIGAASAPLKPITQGVATTYTLADTAGLAYTPGDTAIFTIPGAPQPGAPNSFPASVIGVLSVPPFTLGPIDTAPPAGQDLQVTWTPPGNESSRVVISLQYAGIDSTRLSEQIVCSMIDDGAHTIRSLFLGGWSQVQNGVRRVQASRWRTSFRDLGDNTELFLQSTFDVERTVFP